MAIKLSQVAGLAKFQKAAKKHVGLQAKVARSEAALRELAIACDVEIDADLASLVVPRTRRTKEEIAAAKAAAQAVKDAKVAEKDAAKKQQPAFPKKK